MPNHTPQSEHDLTRHRPDEFGNSTFDRDRYSPIIQVILVGRQIEGRDDLSTDVQRQYLFIRGALLLIIVVSILYIPLAWTLLGPEIAAPILVGAILFVLAFLALPHVKNPATIGHFLLGFCLLLLSYHLYFLEGFIQITVMFPFTLIPFFAILITGRTGTFIWGSVEFVLLWGFAVAAASGVIPAVNSLGETIFLVGVVGISVICSSAIALYYDRTMRNAQQTLEATNDQLESALFQVQELATVDSLTQTYTRRHFFALAEREIKRAARYQHPLSLAMIDIDHFKSINDRYGHLVGDRVLAEIAKELCRNIRETDLIGRYGGEEFALALPYTEPPEASEIVCNRLRHCIEKLDIEIDQGETLSVTISIGLTSRHGAKDNIYELLDQADKALYDAKNRGRNCVAVFGEN